MRLFVGRAAIPALSGLHHRIWRMVIFLSLCLVAAGCGTSGLNLVGGAYVTAQPSATIATPQPATDTPAPTSTVTATETPEPTATATLMPTNTPTLEYHPPGKVCLPILLYHHIVAVESENRYSVSRANFEEQMAALKDLGYTTMSVAQLIRAIQIGENLPHSPMVITFDDGYEDVYLNAFPVLSKEGFTATILLVSSYVGSEEFMTQSEILDLEQAGWEIGSHSQTHLDLTKNFSSLWDEIVQSRLDLKRISGQDINLFAYPYGAADPIVIGKVVKAGYSAGLGLGTSVIHDVGNLFYLDRIEVRADMDLASLTQAIACPKE